MGVWTDGHPALRCAHGVCFVSRFLLSLLHFNKYHHDILHLSLGQLTLNSERHVREAEGQAEVSYRCSPEAAPK